MKTGLDIKVDSSTKNESGIHPTSIHCRPACNLVVWQSHSESDHQPTNDQLDKIREHIALIMDQLSDLLRDHHKFAPLVALIKAKKEDSFWGTVTGDQDWHRGRFVLQSVTNNKLEETKKRWLGPLAVSAYSPRKITSEEFSESLELAVKQASPPKGTSSHTFDHYVDNVKAAVIASSASKFIELWQQELLEDINQLAGFSISETLTNGR